MSSYTRQQIFILAVLWLGIFCNYICYSIIAPFFPQLAKRKGLSAEEYSMIFGAYSISQLTFSCLAGKFLTRIGAEFIIPSGLLLAGGATILFGCMEKSPGGQVFLVLSSFIRLAEGAGFAAYFTSALTVIVKTFPYDPGYFVGITEAIVTIGMIAGPPTGSFLYLMGGYPLPFALFGTIMLLTSGFAFFIFRRQKSHSDDDSDESHTSLTFGEYWRVLRLPAAILTILCVCFNVVADCFILITLSEHLQQFSLTTMQVGGVYLCIFISYGISSPLAGKIADKTHQEFLLQCFGCLILVVSFTLIGPAAFIPAKPQVWLIVIGLLLKGLGAGPLISCSYSAVLRQAKIKSHIEDENRLYSIVSSIVSFSIPLGNLLGSVTAGVMYERLGMSLATTVHAGLSFFMAAICLLVYSIDKFKLLPRGSDARPVLSFEMTMDIFDPECQPRTNRSPSAISIF